MRGRTAGLSSLPAVVVVALVLLGGCTDANTEQVGPAPAATPSLGGPHPDRARPPQRAMDRLERPVADRLARQIAGQGLTLTYLDCPPWDGSVPARMTCRGYVDGLVAQVRVWLRAAVAASHKAVDFDARLRDGVIVTDRLESTLRTQGWVDVDCGSVPAYPARVGSRIVCRVQRDGEQKYVVATVRSRAGAVLIADYRDKGTGR